MPSTYTQNLGIEQPATGEQAGVWGNTVNGDFSFFDTGIDGNLSIPLSASAYSLVTQAGVASEGRNKVILWTGALTALATVNIQPNTAKKLYFMANQTTGGFPIVFAQGSGQAVTLQPGYAMPIYCDGAGATASVNPVLANPQFNNVLCQNLTVSGSFNTNIPVTFSQPVTFSAAVTMGAATVTSLTINPASGSHPYDIYYRSSGGPLTSLPIGTNGQLLTATASGPAWTTVSMGLGQPVTGAVNYAIFFYAPGGNNFSQDTRFNINPGVGLGIGLVPTHSLHIGMQLAPEMWLDTSAPATVQRQIVLATNGVARWALLSPAENETGGNAGSNCTLVSYSDAGSSLLNCFSVARATGNVTVGGYGDQGVRLCVLGANAVQPVLVVRGAPSQQYLQTWQNSAGQVVASIDGNGNLASISTSFVQMTSTGRVDLHGTVAGHPLGTIHVGPDGGTGMRGSIALETAIGNDTLPPNVVRMYYRQGAFVLQFYYNGQNYFAWINLVGQNTGAPVNWFIGATPI